LAVQISANTAEFNKRIADTQRGLTSFTGNITKLAGTLGIAFSVQQVAQFALEVSKLSGEAEGVRAAFERLPNNIKLMEDLKRATGGTVSELGLMKRAVQAANFDISLGALPRLLEFATLRAQQTGQSVDYLVDSIVTGIGRKSKLILDNLGISAVQLNEALGGVTTGVASIGDVADAVGKIAESNLKNMAGFSENAATKLQRLEASWTNVKVAIGDAANGTGFLGKSIDALSGSLDLLASKDLTFFEKLRAFFSGDLSGAALEDYLRRQQRITNEQKKQAQVLREVDRYFKEFSGDIDAYSKTIETHIYRTELLAEFTKRLNDERKEEIETLESLKAKQEELNSLFEQTSVTDTKKLGAIGNEIIALNKKIEALEKLRKLEKAKDPLAGKFQFIPDLEAEGSTNPELRNQQAANEAKEFASDLNAVAASAEFAGGALIKLENTSSQVTPKITEGFIEMSGAISGALSSVAYGLGQAITGVGNFGDAILKALAGFVGQVGEALIAIGVGMLAAKQAIKNPYTAIAAGAALVLLSGAMGGAMSRAQSNFNSGAMTNSPNESFTTPQRYIAPNAQGGLQIYGTVDVSGEKLRILLSNVDNKNSGRRG
jgi:hypothetical protein